jgi:type IX secretion system PorP/SprF family membrane protein
MKRLSILILATALSFAAMAQDIHFSQFYMAPLQLNPAMTGVMNCNQRLGANYRNQWASVLREKAFQTYQVAYDAKIPVGRYDYFGLGGSIWSDVAGSLSFRSTLLNLDFAYTKRMGGGSSRNRHAASYLSMGAKVGLAQRGLNLLEAKWGNQARDGQWDPNAASGEPVFGTANSRDNFLFGDVSAGLLWFSVMDENNNFYIGGAYDHINRANQSFSNDPKTPPVPLLSKFTIHAGGEFQTNDRITLLPGIVTFLQGPYMQINGGTSMRFLLGSSKRSAEAIQFGAWARLGNKVGEDNKASGILMDALILSTRFDYSQFSLGFSYDYNVSALNAATNGNGSFEFALQYKICGNERRNLYCPNF